MGRKIRVKINGFNLKHVIGYLIERGVLVSDLKIKSKCIVFIIDLKDKIILDKYCSVYNKKYQILNTISLKEGIKNLRYSLGCIFAFILTVLYVMSYNFVIFEIKISNGSQVNYDLSKVKEVLNSYGVKGGGFVKNVSSIEEIILSNVSDIAGCSVEFIGGKLNVFVLPEINIDDKIKSKLFSKFDAVITDINVYSGNGKFNVGDIIKKGDMLVESSKTAEADIYGNVYFTSSILYNKNRQKIRFTGNYQVNKKYYLFNKILFKNENNIVFANYLTKKCGFYIMENYLFPLKCESEYCFEYEVINDIVEFEIVEKDVKKKLYDEVVLNVPNNAKILNVYYSVVKEGDFTRVDCFVEANVSLI